MLDCKLSLCRSGLVYFGLAAVTIVAGSRAVAQESGDGKLPEAAKLALRAKSGDMVKMEGQRKVTAHIHLEALLSEFSTETLVKDDTSFQFRGRGPNGTLQIEIRDNVKVTATNAIGQAVKPTVVHQAAIYTVKPNLEVVKTTALTPASASKSTAAYAANSAGLNSDFGAIRLPDKTLKPGDMWTGQVPMRLNDDLKGTTLSYQATLIGFEMYQSFPCAHVEVNYSYKGRLPAIDAQVRKSLPKATKVESEGQLTGTETVYYVLDRGWPLNAQLRLTIAINLTITANNQTLDVGGTLELDEHSAVNAYPPYDPSLVPSVTTPSPN
jgi:hypothetical protein